MIATDEIDRWHVLPINDIKEHIESEDCECEPTVEVQENGNVVIVHNAFDGREGVEMANEILNNK